MLAITHQALATKSALSENVKIYNCSFILILVTITTANMVLFCKHPICHFYVVFHLQNAAKERETFSS